MVSVTLAPRLLGLITFKGALALVIAKKERYH
jgi:hypothetical protein